MRTIAILLIAVSACGTDPVMPPIPTDPEGALRYKLGVPPDAKRVIVFAQTAHLDIDWQFTFDQYYSKYVGDIFTEARGILDTQPRSAYSVAEMAYLQNHVAQHPEELDALKKHAASGALRIVGGGMTSPDTLLPETEMLARDILFGNQFAEDVLGAHPRSFWLPDSFGHGATVPDILSAAGYTSVGFARIDGAPTFYETVLKPQLNHIKPNSDAQMLKDLGSADFWWTGPGGGKVLAHYINQGLYCTGDDIDYKETLQTPGGHFGPYYGDQPDYVDGRINFYISSFTPYAKTPYMFVPVGCDFQHPKPELISYMDGYNQRQYPTTGVWAVTAPFEDYETLVALHGDQIPEIKGELSPYFMGFYGSRAGVKRAIRDAANPFFEAEAFATVLGDEGKKIVDAAAPQLSLLTRANHHDFVTGTANDMVVMNEQMPLLAAAQKAGEAERTAVIQALASHMPAPGKDVVARFIATNASTDFASGVVDVPTPVGAGAGPFDTVAPHVGGVYVETVGTTLRLNLGMSPWSWQAIDLVPSQSPVVGPAVSLVSDADHATLSNLHVTAKVDRQPDGTFALTSLLIDKKEQLAGPSFLVTDYQDDGGLWRMGHETAAPCAFSKVVPTPASETLSVLVQSNYVARIAIQGQGGSRELGLDTSSTGLDIALVGAATQGQTRTVHFLLAAAQNASLTTGVAAGAVAHSGDRLYQPTYWPAVDWASVGDTGILLRQSTGVRIAPLASGVDLEVMAVRDAEQEQCDAEGGKGTDLDVHRIEWRLVAPDNPARLMWAAQSFGHPIRIDSVNLTTTEHSTIAAAGSMAEFLDTFSGVITAIKPATRGDGVIVRVLLSGLSDLWLPFGSPLLNRHWARADLAERDLEDLGVNTARMIPLDPMKLGSLVTLRLK